MDVGTINIFQKEQKNVARMKHSVFKEHINTWPLGQFRLSSKF